MAEKKTLGEALKTTWPYKAVQGILNGITLPGDVYAGKVDPMSDEGFQRVQELAGVAMTGGIPFGPGNVPGTALMSGATKPGKLPKLREVVHGTNERTLFAKPTPAASADLGVHVTPDPAIANVYSLPQGTKLTGVPDGMAGPRSIPMLADIRNPLPLRRDTYGMMDRDEFMKILPKDAPPGLLSDLAAVPHESWPAGAIPAIKKHGYDSLKYPHEYEVGGQAFSVLDESQLIPRFSKEAMDLIKERGVVKQKRVDKMAGDDDWFFPLFGPDK